MPTLPLVYLTEQQYADMTDHAHAGAANNTTAEEQLPSINQEQTRLPNADATRNASSNKQSDHEDEDNDYHIDTLLQEATRITGVNRRSFRGHAVRHQQQVQQGMVLSSDEESENDSSSSERVRVVDAVKQFQHEMVSNDEESENDSKLCGLSFRASCLSSVPWKNVWYSWTSVLFWLEGLVLEHSMGRLLAYRIVNGYNILWSDCNRRKCRIGCFIGARERCEEG